MTTTLTILEVMNALNGVRSYSGFKMADCPSCRGIQALDITDTASGLELKCSRGCNLGEIERAIKPDVRPALPVRDEPVQSAPLTLVSAETNPFSKGFMWANELPEAVEIVPLWYGIYPGRVTLFNGQTGAGKSSLLYSLAVHAARNEPLYGIPFGVGRPLRVLFLDPENAGDFESNDGGLTRTKLDRIGGGYPANLCFHNGRGVDLLKQTHLDALTAFVTAEAFDIVIADPIANLFNIEDENSNAEAARQMRGLTDLSRNTGAAVVAVHHTGKSGDTDFGRGATARLSAADVGLTFTTRGNAEEGDDTYAGILKPRTDVVRLRIVKNRLEGIGSLYLRMVGRDRFEVATYADFQAGKSESGPTKTEQALDEIRNHLADNAEHGRPEIIAALDRENIGRTAAESALKILTESGDVIVRKGEKNASFYRLSGVSQFPDSLRNQETGKLNPSLQQTGGVR